MLQACFRERMSASGYNDCEQRCVNRAGSYACECEEGFRADELDPRKCNSIAGAGAADRCSACSHFCNDVGQVSHPCTLI